jgi:hypothetical protein
VDVVGGGGGGVVLITGGGGGVGVGAGGGAGLAPTKSQSPMIMPAACGAKKANKPSVRSSPFGGHPGQVSEKVAIVDLPP